MLRQEGQKTLQCDGCGIQFDDRPRHLEKRTRKEASAEGWFHVPKSDALNSDGDLDFCPKCHWDICVAYAKGGIQ